MLKRVNKLWGYEEWLQADGGKAAGYCGKFLTILSGAQGSLHYHLRKRETMYVQEGELCLELIPNREVGTVQTRYLRKGGSFEIPPGMPHRMSCPKGVDKCVVIEFSTPHSDADVIRLEPSKVYGVSKANK